MKKTKVIIPALAVMLLSTAASVTGTVAWFSMNNFVTASGMNIQAKAENGIVIANAANSATWIDSATAAHAGPIAVYPTSTHDGTTWAHSSSNNANSATSNGQYTMLTLETDATTGAGFVDQDNDDTYTTVASEGHAVDSAYYLLNSFYIKSSAEAITKPFYVNSLTVTGNTSTPAFDRSLRVLVKVGNSSQIFAAFADATLSYNVCTAINAGTPATTATTAVEAGTADTQLVASLASPAYSAAPLEVQVYLYFEGEDANCKSTNLIATLDTLNVSIQFGTKANA